MKSWVREVGVVLAYGLLSVLVLLPLSLHPATNVAYVGDGLGTVYFVAEMARRLVEDPTHLFQAGLAYPHANASLFEAHRLLLALLASPVLLVTGNPILATNAVTSFAYVFNGWSARWLGLRLGLSSSVAFVAGCLFAFNTYAINEVSRANVLFLGFVPLALGSFLAYFETGQKREAWKVALLLLAQGYAENYNLVYGVLLLGLILVLYVVARPRVAVQRVGGLVLPGLLAASLFLPIVSAYTAMDREYDYRREAPHAMGLEHYLAPLPGNVLYGSLGRAVRGQQLGPHFVGFGALALAALAVGGA